jgi:hypothetical protein
MKFFLRVTTENNKKSDSKTDLENVQKNLGIRKLRIKLEKFIWQ